MESPNLHHQDVQLVVVGSSSSSPLPPLPTPPSYSYGAAPQTNHAWSSPNNLLLNTNLNPSFHGDTTYNYNRSEARNDDFTPHHNFSMTQNLGLKEELSLSPAHSNHIPKFTETLTNIDLSEKLLLNTISASSFHFNGHDQLGDHRLYSSSPSTSQIYPTINVSSLGRPGSAAEFSSSSSSLDHMFKDGFRASSGLDRRHQQVHEQLHQRSSSSPSKALMRASSSFVEPSHKPKKARFSCPTLKVRKEKLGDRIAALQQLVAPFGKTDTASVLMEAIGYIQFLQNQVKTLSVPYMKPSRNETHRTMQGGSEGNEETRRDLRSRGLCLVPLSCTSYVDSIDGGGSDGLWPPPPTKYS